MTVETGTYISDFNATLPTATDLKSEGDDHIRIIKLWTKQSFPNVTGAVTATHGALSALAGSIAPTTFTPTVAFGGASVGVTYSSQVGKYTRLADGIRFTAYIVLTSKGSSVGVATIAGLPTVGAVNSAAIVGVAASNMSGLTGAVLGIIDNASSVTIFQYGATGPGPVANTFFTNTTILQVSGFYAV